MRLRLTPALTLLLLAPFVGEVISTSTSLFALPLPQIGGFAVVLYGGGALLVREVVRRLGLGVTGLLLLGAAYGVFEEALVVRSWFAPEFSGTAAEAAYSRVWGTNVNNAVHLTLFHSVVSIWASITLVELLFPDRRTTPWARRRGLAAAAAGLVAVLALSLATDAFFPVPLPQFLAACALTGLLVALALRRRGRVPTPAASTPAPLPARTSYRTAAAVLAVAVATAGHFVLIWSLPHSAVPWPLGLSLAVLPPTAALLYCRRLRLQPPEHRALAVIVGLLAPLVLLDVLLGLGGRIDLLLTAAISIAGLAWIAARTHRQLRPVPVDRLGGAHLVWLPRVAGRPP
ncbi:hypothetical protein [Kineosporia sp. A_224]|uniref:hypothetical protein n=1 Tax=Kineosporia sp. A_224 TaxID=1962180 RepID=UPI000B4C109A|nr:hypothetical protein [Kineosporia sp. A_224]